MALLLGYSHYTGVSVMFGVGLLMLWLRLAGHSIRDLSARAIFGLTGYLRARPDPWLEHTLCMAFADFDRELAAILRDRGTPALPSGSPRMGSSESQPGRSANS